MHYMVFITLACIVLSSFVAAFCLDIGFKMGVIANWVAVLANTFVLFSYIPKSVF